MQTTTNNSKSYHAESRRITERVAFSWKIKNLRAFISGREGEYIRSPSFIAGGMLILMMMILMVVIVMIVMVE